MAKFKVKARLKGGKCPKGFKKRRLKRGRKRVLVCARKG